MKQDIIMIALRRSFCLLFASFICMVSWSKTIEKGYHGFVDAGYSIKLGTNTAATNWLDISTVHGYQINSYLFVGGGLGYQLTEKMRYGNISGYPYIKRDRNTDIPLFADFRYTVLDKKITPFIEARLGHYLTNGSGPFLSAGVGCRFALKKGALNFRVAYTRYEFKYEEMSLVSYYNIEKIGSKYISVPKSSFQYKDYKNNSSNLSFTVGYEF